MERLLWKVAGLLMDYLDGGLSAFEFYRYRKDWVVARVAERGAKPDAWPVAVAWIVAPWANPRFIDQRIEELRILPANIKFLGMHERTIERMEEKGELLATLRKNGMGLFTYSAYSIKDILLQPDYIPGQFSEHWHGILEEIETYRFLEKY